MCHIEHVNADLSQMDFGHTCSKRIDFPILNTSNNMKIDAARFNCWRAWKEPIYIRSFSVHKKNVPSYLLRIIIIIIIGTK